MNISFEGFCPLFWTLTIPALEDQKLHPAMIATRTARSWVWPRPMSLVSAVCLHFPAAPLLALRSRPHLRCIYGGCRLTVPWVRKNHAELHSPSRRTRCPNHTSSSPVVSLNAHEFFVAPAHICFCVVDRSITPSSRGSRWRGERGSPRDGSSKVHNGKEDTGFH